MQQPFLRVQSPDLMGLSNQAILDFFAQHEGLGIHSLAVVKEGQYYALAVAPFAVNSPHTLFSLSKSFCSMAAGIAVEEGLISYEDSVAEVLSDCLPEKVDKRVKDITLHHLLSMSSGLDEKSDHEIRSSADWARAALSYKVVHKPGTRFHYNTMGTYLAGRMVSARTGMSLRDYLLPRLFAPLGIAKPQWDCCPQGYNVAGFGLHLSVEDLARTAQLLQNGGLWQGRRLLSEEYLRRATSVQVENRNLDWDDPHEDWMGGYGYQFWMAQHNRYRGDGMYGQVMMMDRASGLAVCCTAGLHMMGDQMDALHNLMDALLVQEADPKASRAALSQLEAGLKVAAPKDAGGPVMLEGSYQMEEGKSLRIETPDEDSLRLIFRDRAKPTPLFLSFGRKQTHTGQFLSGAMGERPQPYLGRFGVQESVLTASLVMPEAPYKSKIVLTKSAQGLHLQMTSVGLDNGSWPLLRIDHQEQQ